MLDLLQIIPALGYARFLINPSSTAAKNQYAFVYIIGFCISNTVFFVMALVYGYIAWCILLPTVSLSFAAYFYLCLKSYAELDELLLLDAA